MHIHRPTRSLMWTRTLPASLRLEDVRRLHDHSRMTGRPIRRLVTDAVIALLDDIAEGRRQAA